MTRLQAFDYLQKEVSKLGLKYDTNGAGDRIADKHFTIVFGAGSPDTRRSGIGGSRIPMNRNISIRVQYEARRNDIKRQLAILNDVDRIVAKIHNGQEFAYQGDASEDSFSGDGITAVITFKCRFSVEKE